MHFKGVKKKFALQKKLDLVEHIPGGLLCNVNAIFLLITLMIVTTKHETTVAVTSLQSCTILLHHFHSKMH